MVAILMVLTNHEDMGNTGKKTGWYLPEMAHPYHEFKKAGFDLTLVSPKGGKAPLDPSSLEAFKNDPVCKEFLENKDAMEGVENTIDINSVDPAKFDAVFVVGGHGPMFDLPDNDKVNEAVAAIYEKGGIAAAVCHGPAGIVNTKLSSGEYLVKGHEVTCFTNKEEEIIKLVDAMPFLLETKLVEHGAVFKKAKEPWQANVCVSKKEGCTGQVATGQNPNSATPLAEAIVKLLKEK
ncbi:uncharacterized protein [Montipora capricornis]|uniref:uncharacterized protein n=1 Tax=Montipora capricornis TaxID=246305 RepID=UPI0035F1D7BB